MHVRRLAEEAADPESPSPDFEACLEIRHEVFVEGQQVPAELEFDGLDRDAEHFLAFADDPADAAALGAAALGTARMRVVHGVAKAERIAVLDRARGLGLGRALVEAIESRAREQGLPAIRLNAQVAVIPFYEKSGFIAEGEVFVEANIDHRAMTKRLS
jgi:predicted GNAT family N-acyltransferase